MLSWKFRFSNSWTILGLQFSTWIKWQAQHRDHKPTGLPVFHTARCPNLHFRESQELHIFRKIVQHNLGWIVAPLWKALKLKNIEWTSGKKSTTFPPPFSLIPSTGFTRRYSILVAHVKKGCEPSMGMFKAPNKMISSEEYQQLLRHPTSLVIKRPISN